jgi:DNA modification methylase
MILIGDVRERLKELPDQSVNCCVTSPPYWGLRDYGTASWDGGDPLCDHSTARSRGDDIKTGDKQGTSAGSRPNTQRKCARCGAVRIDNQIGLEPTPQEFVDSLVAVFREVKRVLRDDGTLWVNMGDSYNGSGGNHQSHHKNDAGFQGKIGAEKYKGKGRHMDSDGLKPKDLVGVPWMLAFALRADGWYLRQDIIWHKPNPMPESVTDRCTKSHEYIFLLSKSRQYYFDNEAIKEPSSNLGKTEIRFGGNKYGDSDDPKHATKSGNEYTDTGKRNKRDVWTVTTRPFKGAHFATFPPVLIEPCILAGCPKGGTVLDPFFGAGTTGLVAQRHNRKWIGCELNPEYAAIAQTRIEAESNLFTETI